MRSNFNLHKKSEKVDKKKKTLQIKAIYGKIINEPNLNCFSSSIS